MKVLLKIVLVSMVAVIALPGAARAHTTSPHSCADSPRKRACLLYVAIHRTCGHAPNCARWLRVAVCETGRGRGLTPATIRTIRWSYGGPGFYDGGLQFDPHTWLTVSEGYRFAYLAPPRVQVASADRWRRKIGGDPHSSAGWPHCGKFFWHANA